MRSGSGATALTGAGVALAGAAWAVVSAVASGGRPLPLALVFVGTVGAVIGAARLPLGGRRAVLAGVAAWPLVLVAVGGDLLGDGPLGYANASGTAFVVSAAAILTLASSLPHHRLRRVLQVAAAGLLLVPFALGAVAASLVGTVVAAVALTASWSTRRTVTLGVWIAAGLLLATTVIGATYTVGPRTSLLDRAVDGTLGELRVKLWHEAVTLVAHRPLLGVGPGRFAQVSPTAAVRDDAAWAHHEWLQTAAETGLPGGALALALLVWVVTVLWHRTDLRSAIVAAAVLGTAANATFDYVLRWPAVWLGAALLVGASGGLGPPHGARAEQLPRATITATLLLVAVLLAPSPLAPVHVADNAAVRPGDGTLVLPGPGSVRSVDAPVALYETLGAAEELSVELWVATGDPDQDGPARLVTASRGTVHRNLTLGQAGDALVVRIRTSDADWNASSDELTVPGVFGTGALQHVVVATDLDTTTVWVDGEPRWRGPGPGGDFVSWNHTYPLLLGNEATGDRPWRGILAGVTVHDRALDDGEVATRFAGGPADPTSGESRSVVADYRFDGDAGAAVVDRSDRGLGPDLAVPASFATSPPGLLRTLTLEVDRPLVRVGGHLVVLLAWSLAVGIGRPTLARPPVGRLLVAVGLAVALAATILRHGLGRAPSWLDLLGACLGLLAAALAHRPRDGLDRR